MDKGKEKEVPFMIMSVKIFSHVLFECLAHGKFDGFICRSLL